MNKKNQYIVLLLSGFLTSCSNVQPLSFTGIWSYSSQVNENDTVGGKEMVLKQTGDLVTGEWNEGMSTGAVGSGKVKGYIKDDKLFLGYCSVTGSGYKICPEYEEDKSYFIIRNNKMIEYYLVNKKSGVEYKQGDVFILIKQ